jgi:hypothetical protein
MQPTRNQHSIPLQSAAFLPSESSQITPVTNHALLFWMSWIVLFAVNCILPFQVGIVLVPSSYGVFSLLIGITFMFTLISTLHKYNHELREPILCGAIVVAMLQYWYPALLLIIGFLAMCFCKSIPGTNQGNISDDNLTFLGGIIATIGTGMGLFAAVLFFGWVTTLLYSIGSFLFGKSRQ